MAVGVRAGRIDIAHILRQPGSRPKLLRLESYERQSNDNAALTALGKQKGLRTYRCTTPLEAGSYQLNQIDAPDVPATELREAVRWRLKDMLDYPVDACTVDVLPVPVQNLAGRPQPLFAVSASNAVLAPLIQSFDEARLNLEVVDIPEMAQRNIAVLCEEENRGLAFLSFDATGGLLTFNFQGELYVARRIEVTAEQIEKADGERRKQLYERISLELQRSLDNFERLYNFITVSRVVLGPSGFASELVDFLHEYVYVPVAALNLTDIVDCDGIPEILQPALQAERLYIIGAALREDAGGVS